jgi:nitrite reductase (NADH) large subunit
LRSCYFCGELPERQDRFDGVTMRIVIIGNGIAGVTVAETIRGSDKNCPVTIISNEKYPFYSRPRLIDFLAGNATIDQITIHAQGWYAKNNIRLVLSSRITDINPVSKNLRDNFGKTFIYDTVVIATGASCLVPPIPGIEADTILTLRTIGDAEKIRALATEGKRAAVIGGGLLGIEVAASLQLLGIPVTVIEVFDRLLPRQLDGESSGIIQKLLEEKGMKVQTGRKVQSIQRNNGSQMIACSDGQEIVADFIVISAGIQPDFSLIDGTPVERNRGIMVDECMRTTVPDIYACGDVAEYQGKLSGLWQTGREQGVVCGSHILGKELSYKDTMSSAWLKVAGIDLVSIGEIESKEGVRGITEKDDTTGLYKKVFLKNNKLVGAVLIGNVQEAVKLQRMIKSGEDFSS